MHLETEKQALKSGYVKSPNNIHSLPGHEWYAGGPDIPEIRSCGATVRIENSNKRPVALYTTTYGKPEPRLCMRFLTWGDYLSYCLLYGTRSKPGQPSQY